MIFLLPFRQCGDILRHHGSPDHSNFLWQPRRAELRLVIDLIDRLIVSPWSVSWLFSIHFLRYYLEFERICILSDGGRRSRGTFPYIFFLFIIGVFVCLIWRLYITVCYSYSIFPTYYSQSSASWYTLQMHAFRWCPPL